MNPAEIGFIQRALLKYRVIETKPSGSRSAWPGEIRAAQLLDDAPEDGFEFVRSLLLGQGFHLSRHTHMDMAGIRDTAYCIVYMDPNDGGPVLLAAQAFFRSLASRRSFKSLTSQTAMAGWFMVLWLVAMGRLYKDRDWGEISKFSSALIDGEVFAAEVDGILSRAQELVVSGKGTWLCGVLVGDDALARPPRSKVDARCFDFLDALSEAGWLDPLGKTRQYRQTLLGAVDVAEKMRLQFAAVLPSADVLEDSAGILMKTAAASPACVEDEGGEDVSYQPS